MSPPDERLIEATFRWMGPGMPATDYDRACDVEGYLGLLDIGAGQGLVLGDEPDSTAWQSFGTSGDREEVTGGILIRWVYANSEADVMAAVDHLPASMWVDDGLEFSVGREPLYLLDAACDASCLDDDDHLTIYLPSGRYTLATADFEFEVHTRLLLHRLVWMSGGTDSDIP